MQLSDLHFNERVELASNRYDFTVAAADEARRAFMGHHLYPGVQCL